MPKHKKIIFSVEYEQDPEKARQAMDCVMNYIWHIAMRDGWFDGILPKPDPCDLASPTE